MTDEVYTGHWVASYFYGKTYGQKAGEGCDFSVQLRVRDGVLSGTATEEVTEKHMGTPATLSGFIEEGMISMIKHYPCWYQITEKGEVVLDWERKHEVHYTGMFDPETQSFSGDWEIESKLGKGFFWGDDYVRVHSGTWEMKKRPDSSTRPGDVL